MDLPRPILPDTLYAQKDLAAVGIKYTRQHLRLLARKGEFPAAVKIGQGKNARNHWLGSELIRYLADRVKERDRQLEVWRRDNPDAVRAAHQ